MTTGLTSEEVSWLDGIFVQVNEELNEKLVKLGQVPIRYSPTGYVGESSVESHTERLRLMLKREAHSEDFIALEALGRVRLSAQTRKAEMRRLNRKYGRRKKYKLKYGKKHHKSKQATNTAYKKEYNNRRWESNPLERLRYTLRKPVDITQEDWDRCIQPVWSQYDRRYLRVKASGPKVTIHSMIIEYKAPRERYSRHTPKPVVVYDGMNQAIYDAMV